MKHFSKSCLLVFLVLLASCATTPQHTVSRTGNIMVDGPDEIAHGPKKDRVLWQYRTAAAAMRQGKFSEAKQNLDDALRTVQGVYGPDSEARKARGYFHPESKKTFIGEPYERLMAYIYRGILYWMDGQIDNARAAFRSAEFEDGDAVEHEYAGDWVLPDYFDGLATTRLGGDGSDAFKRAQAAAKAVPLPPYNPQANVIFFFELGPGPSKIATGQYEQELRFRVSTSPVKSAELKVNSLDIPVGPTDDLYFQATTRGGRVMDHVLANKAVFKATTDTVGNAALIAGLGTAAFSHDQTAQEIGLGIAVAGLVSKLVSAAATPQADVRAWDNLPRYLSFATVPLPVGTHIATIEFLDASRRPIARLTKTISINVTDPAHDKVIFVSDSSITPQTL